MSGRLVSAVFDSALPAWLKPYAAACASFALDDGSRIYPTVARVANMVGRCERSTHYALHELRRRGVLTVEVEAGRYRATRYAFHVGALPQVGDADQLPLFPQSFQQGRSKNAGQPELFHKHPQPGEKWVAVMGATHCTRSVIDPPRTSTNLRAREKGKYPKTGTDDGR